MALKAVPAHLINPLFTEFPQTQFGQANLVVTTETVPTLGIHRICSVPGVLRHLLATEAREPQWDLSNFAEPPDRWQEASLDPEMAPRRESGFQFVAIFHYT